MNPRERSLLTVLFVVLGVLGAGVVFYFFVYQDYADLSAQVASDNDKLNDKKKAKREAEDERDRLLLSNPHLKDWQHLSLPYLPPTKGGAKHTQEETEKHIAYLQGQYQDNLETSLFSHHFTKVKVKALQPDNKTPDGKGGVAAKDKTPVYTRLPFSVHASATYGNIIEMLKDFYNEPLLQEVRRLSITKPPQTAQTQPGGRGGRGGAGRGGIPGGGIPGGGIPGGGIPGGGIPGGGIPGGGIPGAVADDAPGGGVPGAIPGGGLRQGRLSSGREPTLLELDMTIEVLMVTGAEYRTALLPSKIKSGDEPVLARPDRDYKDMLARDPFNGKPSKLPVPGGEVPLGSISPQDKEVLNFVKLTGIFQKADRNRWYATFYDQGGGPPEVLVNTLTIPMLRVNDSTGKRIFEAEVLYIEAKELVLQDKANNKYYLMHIGDYLQPALEEQQLDSDGLKKYGLTPKKVAVAPE